MLSIAINKIYGFPYLRNVRKCTYILVELYPWAQQYTHAHISFFPISGTLVISESRDCWAVFSVNGDAVCKSNHVFCLDIHKIHTHTMCRYVWRARPFAVPFAVIATVVAATLRSIGTQRITGFDTDFLLGFSNVKKARRASIQLYEHKHIRKSLHVSFGFRFQCGR